MLTSLGFGHVSRDGRSRPPGRLRGRALAEAARRVAARRRPRGWWQVRPGGSTRCAAATRCSPRPRSAASPPRELADTKADETRHARRPGRPPRRRRRLREGRPAVTDVRRPAERAEGSRTGSLRKDEVLSRTGRVPEEYDGTPGRVPEEGRSPSRNPGTVRADLEDAVGVGIDVVGIKAFAEQLDEPGTRFAQAFTPGERRAARAGEGSEAESLAARWAAKEAVIKAWSSTCFGHPEVIDPGARRPPRDRGPHRRLGPPGHPPARRHRRLDGRLHRPRLPHPRRRSRRRRGVRGAPGEQNLRWCTRSDGASVAAPVPAFNTRYVPTCRRHGPLSRWQSSTGRHPT